MKASQVLGIIMAIALIVFAVSFPVPRKHLSTSSYGWDKPWNDEYGEEYVGGDAYNYQMEASLKAGYMSGVLSMKAITFVGGVLLFFLSLYSHAKCAEIKEQSSILARLAQTSDSSAKHLLEISGDSKKQLTLVKALSDSFEQYAHPAEESSDQVEMD